MGYSELGPAFSQVYLSSIDQYFVCIAFGTSDRELLYTSPLNNVSTIGADNTNIRTLQIQITTANVEYQLEIQFIVNENLHKVKLSCYTTTCNILIQNMGDKSESKDYLDDQHPSKFFVG